LIVLKVIIAGLDVIAKPEQIITGFETRWVVLALMRRKRAYKMSNVLFLESEKDIEGRKETLFFSLCFLLETRVKVTSSASGTLIAISILGL